jgi:hypothetical protein
MYYCNDVDINSTTSTDCNNSGSLLCLQVLATDENSFLKHSNISNEMGKVTKIDLIFEFRNIGCLWKILDALGRKEVELTREESKRYFHIIQKDSLKEKSKRTINICSPKIKRMNPFLAGKKDSDILLTYPFNGPKEDIERCADRLKKAGYATSAKVTKAGETSSRANSFVIRVVDYASLEPGEWLNDTMIDFWLQWYVLGVAIELANGFNTDRLTFL